MPATPDRGTQFFIMRHAATAWNRAGRIQGHHDTPLTPEGKRQIAAWRAHVDGLTLDRI
ncbi:MAG: histidine phosphatase family protein, partial [Desulfosarcina sp.]|nr:histidine phosphatase family protein [Desulfobacterales bacterium]